MSSIYKLVNGTNWNEWWPLAMRGQKLRCCGCGLVHKLEVRRVIVRGKPELEFRIRGDWRATAASRRSRRWPCEPVNKPNR